MQNVQTRILTERISYLPATDEPLSADVGIVRGDRFCWIFDVGNSEKSLRLIEGIRAEKNVVLSHFHADHCGNFARVSCHEMYCGRFTQTKLKTGTEVQVPVTIDDGVRITLFPIPSTHSRGAVGLAVNDEYAFLGDAVYGMRKAGEAVYNVSLLNEMIMVLEAVKVRDFLLSHDPDFARPKEQVIRKLKELYRTRMTGEAFLHPGEEYHI